MTEIAAELHMSRGQKITNLLGVTIPFAGFLASIFFLWGQYVTWRDLVIFAVGYALTTLGISIGFHRLFTHRSYETFKSIRYGLAVLGSMAVQGPVIRWVSDHRKHHSFADREGDPHSPHAGFGPGVRGKIAGLWHAHVGWLFRNVGRAEWTKYAKDLLADRGMVFISRWFGLWVGLSLLLPFIAGWLWGGTIGAGLQALFWGGLIRIFLLHHITWSVNSVCHFVGSRRFRVKDESRNVWWLSWISFGESWHHNHHAFPSSAFHGLKPWELDIGGLVIRLMRRLGLVWKVNVPSREMQQRRREAPLRLSRMEAPETPPDSPLTLETAMASPLYRRLMDPELRARRAGVPVRPAAARPGDAPAERGARPARRLRRRAPGRAVFGSYT